VKYTVSLKENRQFRRLYAKGKSAVSPYLVLYYRKNGRQQNLLGITVSGKMGNAVVRNKLRRRLREIYRTNEERFLPGFSMVVVARGRAVSSQYVELERSFLQLANKCKLLHPKGEDTE
jgi:ribonuclease P protein component